MNMIHKERKMKCFELDCRIIYKTFNRNCLEMTQLLEDDRRWTILSIDSMKYLRIFLYTLQPKPTNPLHLQRVSMMITGKLLCRNSRSGHCELL